MAPNAQTEVHISATESSDRVVETNSLPPFQFDKLSRTLCLTGLVATFIVSIVSIGFASRTFVRWKDFANDDDSPVFNSSTTKEISSLIFNICVTLCTETVGFIHATSLRWALYHEGRLDFNSNLRLFTNAKKCVANSWYTNCLWALLITISYSTASQVLQPMGGSYHYDNTGPQAYALNSQALAILGIALLLQTMLALWCMFPSKSRRILSWNSAPLNTTLALLHENRIQRIQGTPAAPQHHQLPARKPIKSVVVIVVLLWILFPVVLIWGLTMWFVIIKDDDGTPNASFDPENTSSVVSTYSPYGHSTNTLIPLAIITAVQIVYTLSLHAAEQIINLTRDEAAWRRAGDISESSAGADISPTSIKMVLFAWQSWALLLLKPVSHWIFGLSIVAFSFPSVSFNPVPIFCLAGLSLVLALMVSFLAFRKPQGPQPAAWGDLKKLANFVDDWGGTRAGRLYWGDKGVKDSTSTRLAGTSPLRDALTEIRMNGELYLGMG